MNRPIVYISGPISKGDPAHNYDQASAMHRRLIIAGFAPINPVLTITLPWEAEVEHATWIDCDLPLVECADALIRLPGESAGADAEVEHARSLGIPVYLEFSDLVDDRDNIPTRLRRCVCGDLGCGRDSQVVQASLDGIRGEDQKRIAEAGVSIVATLLRKNRDYGGSAWTTPVFAPDMPISSAILVRMSDKVSRITTMLKAPTLNPEVNESLMDTFRDLVGYGILYISLPRIKDEYFEFYED